MAIIFFFSVAGNWSGIVAINGHFAASVIIGLSFVSEWKKGVNSIFVLSVNEIERTVHYIWLRVLP